MSKSNNRIPFKSSNNKNSPYNMNEIDINLLMSNPKHIHKMMGKEECDDKDDVLPLIDVPKHLRKAGSDMKDNLKFFKETGSGLLKKYMDKDKTEPKRKHRTIAERMDKTQSNMYKKVDGTVDAVTGAAKNFKNDVKKKGLGRTVGNRKDRWDDLISDFINGEAMMKIGKKLEPSSEMIMRMKNGGIEAERERERKRGIINTKNIKERKERIDNFNKE